MEGQANDALEELRAKRENARLGGGELCAALAAAYHDGVDGGCGNIGSDGVLADLLREENCGLSVRTGREF